MNRIHNTIWKICSFIYKGNNKITEQFYKGKVKTHKYINRQNQSTTGKLWKRNDPDLAYGISLEMTGWIRF